MIDWSKLKPYKGFKWKSFEKLCYSIARRFYHNQGNFTPIDDSGGGDGVEFYLTMPDGMEWGWQAKFYYPEPRLKKSGRKTSIRNSLKRADKNHKRLKKWFLCTPTDFTTHEIKWFKELQQKYPNVILEHWGDSDFNDFLTNPLLLGIKNYYFGNLELSIDWFRAQVEKQVRNVGDRFIPGLHTETHVDFWIHTLLGDSVFRQHLEEQITRGDKRIAQFQKTVEELCKTATKTGQQDARNKISVYSAQLGKTFTEITQAIVDTRSYLSAGQIEKIGQINWDLLERELGESLDGYSQAVREFEKENLREESKEKDETRVNEYARQKASASVYLANEVADLLHMLDSDIKTATLHELHIFGGAGIGKTHVACHISRERITRGLPAILLLGKHFTSDIPIENQILKILGIPNSYSWEDFVQALQSAAEAYNTKIPIVIDALNEAQSVDKWKSELPGIIYELETLPLVALITTCRSNYRSAIWSPSEPKHMIETYGFGRTSLREAIMKYFDWYKIKCDLTLGPLRQFSNPIFLRIFCETQNRERKEEKQIYLGEQTLLQVFENYIIKCNQAVCSKLSRRSSANVVQDALRNFGKELWKQKSRCAPLSEAVKLVDSKDVEHLDWPKSITNALLDEGLLINRDRVNGEEVVLFTYDLLGGYIIAKEISDRLTPKKIGDFVKSKQFRTYLLSNDFSDTHPLHEDILRCFALLLPMHFGKHLYELTDDKTALNYSIRALFEIAPKLIDNSSKELIARLFSRPENRMSLLKLAQTTMTHVGHPLNIEFWDKLLLELSLPERDLSWTEYVRRNTSDFFNDLDRFENTCKEAKSLTTTTEQRLLLAARFFRWLLTSTVRPLRDTATRALYWYGRRFPRKFFDLVLESLSLNDPYVPERLLAAAYGITMALQHDFGRPQFREEILPYYAKKLYTAMFKSNASYATTHILTRDYASHIIDMALIHKPDILTSKERRRVKSPFADGGIRKWGQSEDRDEDIYREGSMPIHMDFGNYTLGSLVRDRGNYDFNHAGYKKVRAEVFWRIYDLGYSHDLFKEIDREIHRYNWHVGRAGNGGKIDRYGKKYSWIAFYELAGFRRDNGLLPENYSEKYRISDADIDPSFPEPVQECEVIKTDYLGDRSISLPEWIENGGVPDLTPYLMVEKLCDEQGPWVLLDGYINQEDLKAKRARFIFPRGLVVKKDEASEIVECLKNQNLGGRWLPEILEDYYTYAGEIPRCETFAHNGMTDIDFVAGSRIERGPEKGVARLSDRTEARSSQVLIPVRYYHWEEYHSTVNKAGSGVHSTAYKISNSTYDSGWLPYTTPFRLRALTDGAYTIKFNSTDKAGNIETTNKFNLTLFSWTFVFHDSDGRGTTLKINTQYKLFQFTAPAKDFGVRNDPKMTVLKNVIVICYNDSTMRLVAVAVVGRLDSCTAVAWDKQTGKTYWLIDTPNWRGRNDCFAP